MTPARFVMTLGYSLLYASFQTTHWIGLALDEILFPGYRSIKVREPIFAVGIPRSGTTLMHKLLARDEQFTTHQLWECLFGPSITERYICMGLYKVDQALGGFGRKLVIQFEKWALGPLDNIHRIRFCETEEEYIGLSPVWGCVIFTLPFPTSQAMWALGKFDVETPPEHRRRMMKFYRRMLQRHLYIHGADKRILSKNPHFSPFIESLREEFPDCKVLAQLRDPRATIPSTLSTMQRGADWFYYSVGAPPYRDKFLDVMRFYYDHLTQRLAEWPEDQRYVLLYDDLKADLQGNVRAIYQRFGVPLSEEFAETLSNEDQKSRRHVSKHKYTLEQFGLTVERMDQEFEGVMEALRTGVAETTRS